MSLGLLARLTMTRGGLHLHRDRAARSPFANKALGSVIPQGALCGVRESAVI